MLKVLEKIARPSLAQTKAKTNGRVEMGKCYMKLNQKADALRNLLLIPREQRSIRTLLTIAQLYRDQGQFNHARTLYAEILQRNPMATEALLLLSELDVDSSTLTKGTDHRKIQTFLTSSTTDERKQAVDMQRNARGIQFLQENLVRAHCAVVRSKYTEALQSFTALRTNFPRHLHSIRQIALCHTRRGNFEKAKYAFEEVRKALLSP